MQALYQIAREAEMPLPKEISTTGAAFLARCFIREPQKRPDAKVGFCT